MIRAMIFDIGDTMEPSTALQKLALQKIQKRYKLPMNFIKTYLKEDAYHEPHMFHAQGNEKIMRHVVKRMGLSINTQKITRELKSIFWSELDNWMKSSNGKQLKATFDWLKNNGYRVCILSDNSIGAKRKYKMLWRKYGLKYDNFIVSQEVGWEKPDRRMIEAIPKALGIANSEAVHFGNNIYRDAACRKWGMPFVLVTGYLIKYGEMHFNGPKIKYISPNSITAVLSRVIR